MQCWLVLEWSCCNLSGIKISCGEDGAVAGLEQATVTINRLDEDEKTNQIFVRFFSIFIVGDEKGQTIVNVGRAMKNRLLQRFGPLNR